MFNNYGRQIVDSAITAMSRSVLKKKKKDLVRIMEREGDNTPTFLMRTANRIGKSGAFEKNKAGFAVALDYKKATHYFVSSLPNAIVLNSEVGTNRLKCLYDIGDVFTVESECKGVDIFTQFLNLDKDTIESDSAYINGDRLAWSFNVFLRAVTENICPVHYPLYMGYISADLKRVYFIANGNHPIAWSFDTNNAKFTFGDKGSYTVKAIVKNDKAKLVTTVFEHLMDCVTVIYKEIIDSKSKRVQTDESDVGNFIADFLNNAIKGNLSKIDTPKECKEHAVSIAKAPKVEVEIEDKLVSLHTYLKVYAPSKRKAPKGGHHASPIPHDRRGFYRKSRGKGDYDLVDGEFLYVGDKKGLYSWVPATHVGEKKTNNKPTLIYKV